ncbi:phage tail protein [Marinifilum sp. N1E240]|uniref:phage tail protein n=1 Tax=Marinifilum sp. N1E240 TaxID=2608082 RepID=UPI00128E0FD1|nr:tail fiber protein [Marinifilum sp. N1E240]MPQ49125.1 phage tail protein [Marinifilum sp. N1E240]
MEGTMAEIRGFAGTFNPKGWAFCQGQILAIADFQALFALVSNYYGGDGRNTFGIPDLRGRVPIGSGMGPGLSSYQLSQKGGLEYITLTNNQLPSHNHIATASAVSAAIGGEIKATMNVNNSDGEVRTPAGNYLGLSGGDIYQDIPSAGNTLNSAAIDVDASGLQVAVGDVSVQIGNAGNGSPFPIVQPYLCINWIMCVDGLFPQRS